jgi:TolB protein
MQKLKHFFLILAASTAATLITTRDVMAEKTIDAGDVIVEGSNAITVSVSGSSPELNSLAFQAFNAHGAFNVNRSTKPSFEIRFSSVGAAQVNVQVSRGGAVVLNQNASGTSLRNAFFRAADAAVKATSGQPGFFACKLAFISNRTGKDEVYVSDLFLGEVRQITHDNAFALTPRWSPDGAKLVYTSYFKSGFPDIFLVNLATMQRTTFVSFQGTNSGARFSPNGQQVAMVLSGEGRPEIYVSNADGRQVSRRTNSEAVKSSPCFSPDGSRIVFSCEPGPQLYVMQAGGGTPQRITSGLSRYCAEPDWSRADPNKIAFTFLEGRGSFQIGVLDLKTGQCKKVSAKVPLDAVEPAWLADGRHLVYTARASGTRGLFILDTETGRSTHISSGAAEKASVWGP